MCTATKLGREVAHLDHADGLSVLLAKERHSAVLLSSLNISLHSNDAVSYEDVSVYKRFNSRDLVRGEGCEMSKVKSAELLVYVRACLLNVVAENRAESRLKQVSGRVVAADRCAASILNVGSYRISNADSAVGNSANVDINAVGLLGVVYLSDEAVVVDSTYISNLSAALTVEGGAVKNDGAVALVDALNAACIGKDSNYLSGALKLGIACKFGLLEVREKRLGGLVPPTDVGSCLTRSLLLLEHKLLEGILVNSEIALSGDLASEVYREAEGIVKLEYVLARDNVAVIGKSGVDEVGKNRKTCINSCVKSFLFHRDDLEDIVLLLLKLGVCALALANRRGNSLNEEGMIDSEKLTVAASAADYTAENVSAALVRGDNAVGYHKHSTSGVVGDNADRNIVVSVSAVGLARDSANVVDYLTDGVDLEHIVNALHYASETLESHTGIYVLLSKLGVVAVAVVVELRENVVPDLHKSVAVASGLTVGRATAVLDASVKVYLGAGATRTGAVLPEVVLLTETNYVCGINADLIYPDLVSFLVFLIDRGPEKILGDLKSFGEELPRPRNSLILEVISEGEVTKHLKEGAVASGMTYALKVGSTDTFLTGSNSVAGRDLLACEEFLHGSHTRVDQKKRFVINGDQRIRGKSDVSFRFKECQILLAQVV